MKRFKSMFLVMALSLTGSSLAMAQGGPDYAAIQVDAGATVGELKALRGVNGAPDMTYAPSAASNERRPLDLASQYRAAGITLVRTHDSGGAADIDPTTGTLPVIKAPLPPGGPTDPMLVIFPDLNANPDDPKSYHFEATDKLIAGIRSIGADVIFRLGRGGGTTAVPPDPARYGAIVRHIVLHYNKGWDNGFTGAVRYWEFWNEPDLFQIWWRGTPEQFYELYGSVAQSVKAADPAAQVGGPTVALSYGKGPFRDGFLTYVSEKRLPLDFFSWHWYSIANDPYDFARIGTSLKGVLTAHGLVHTKLVLDEWNGNVMFGMKDDANQAAFITAARIYMQDAPIDLEAFYRSDSFWGRDGKTPSKAAQALNVFGMIADARTRLRTSGGDTQGLAVQAGRAPDGTIKILIGNYELPADQRGPRQGPDALSMGGLTMDLPSRQAPNYTRNKGYDLKVAGLKPGARYVVERYRISTTNDLGLIDRQTLTGAQLAMSNALPAPAVELIVVRPEALRR
ncbi:GH39 family glycosyl hydrolase [Novosphingobium terrae]|uniref:GH39 family glycosyl hydrolase n=1 Tax=Novosphingobium terrae TaxID=2726189 RepID=UPI0019802FE7|nr:hypothetical protein [Novosphingobium terrae]